MTRRIGFRGAVEPSPAQVACMASVSSAAQRAVIEWAKAVEERLSRAAAVAGVDLEDLPAWFAERGHRMIDEEPVLCCSCGWYAGMSSTTHRVGGATVAVAATGADGWIRHVVDVVEREAGIQPVARGASGQQRRDSQNTGPSGALDPGSRMGDAWRPRSGPMEPS